MNINNQLLLCCLQVCHFISAHMYVISNQDCSYTTFFMYTTPHVPAGVLKLQKKAYKDAAKLFTQVLEVDPTHSAAKKQLDIVQTLL